MASRKFKRVRRNQTDTLRCPLCFQTNDVPWKTQNSGYLDVTCSRCGAFEIENSVANEFWDLPARHREFREYLQCHVRQSYERKEKARITEENWKTLAEERRSTPVKDKWKRLLDLLAARVETLTQIAEIDPEVDRLLVDSPLRGDFEELVSYLAQKGYINRNYADSDDEWVPNWYSLTVDGRSKFEDVTQDQRFTSTGREA